MNNGKFKTLNDLYNHIYPALRSKSHEMQVKGFKYIHEEDIWNYLRQNKWSKARDLDIGSMVNDIFTINEEKLISYISEELKDYHRKADKDEDRKN
ncbi:MAG: post-transcriptional regulator [Ruminococcus sp.]|nr:post-transcriptional regulator [Ruminococcus sp.]